MYLLVSRIIDLRACVAMPLKLLALDKQCSAVQSNDSRGYNRKTNNGMDRRKRSQ